MSQEFDEDIFGETVEPTHLPINPHVMLSKCCPYSQTPLPLHPLGNKSQMPVDGSERHVNDMSSFPSHKTLPRTSITSEKQLSRQSTSIGASNSHTSTQRQNSNKLKDQVFVCPECAKSGQGSKNNECGLCNGQGKIEGKGKFVQFIEFVMDFKMGLKSGYCPFKTGKPRQNLTKSELFNPGNHFEQQENMPKYRSQLIQPSRYEHKEKVHTNFTCNGCGVSPIIGTRYHCPDYQCNDDFDYCENCILKFGHEHQMQEFAYNEIEEKARKIIEFSQQKAKEKLCCFGKWRSNIH